MKTPVTKWLATVAFSIAFPFALPADVLAIQYAYFYDNNGPNYTPAYIEPDPINTTPPFCGSPTGCSSNPSDMNFTPWYIIQFGNPNPIVSGTGSGNSNCFNTSPAWSKANDTSRLCWEPNVGSSFYGAEFALNGSSSSHPLPCNTEFDFFLGEEPYYPRPSYQRFVSSAPHLNTLIDLWYAWGFRYLYRSVATSCGSPSNPALDQVSSLVAIVLSNDVSHQVFYYQMKLSWKNPAIGDSCNDNPSFFDTGTPSGGNTTFGVDVFLNKEFGAACPAVDGNRRAYAFDFLPKLKAQILAGNQYHVDQNLANWWVSGAYVGSYIYGNALVTTLWDNVAMVGHY